MIRNATNKNIRDKFGVDPFKGGLIGSISSEELEEEKIEETGKAYDILDLGFKHELDRIHAFVVYKDGAWVIRDVSGDNHSIHLISN